MFCDDEHRVGTREYWFGLYKLTAAVNGTTAWYDGNPSTYRHWKDNEPNENSICIRYTKVAFADRPCHIHIYYTCRKRSGNLYNNYFDNFLCHFSSV